MAPIILWEIHDALRSVNTYSLSTQLEVPAGEKGPPATWNMFDFFAKSFLQIVSTLGGKQSLDLPKFHQYFQKFRDIAFSRLCTSLEEKGTVDSYHNKIFQREEKAIKDLAALEHQLQFEREERAKAFSRYKIAEQHLHEEEELVREEALEVEQNLEIEFNTLEEHELKIFQVEDSNYNAKCTELKTLLDQLQEDHDIIRAKLEVYQDYFRNKELEEARRQEETRLKNEVILEKGKQDRTSPKSTKKKKSKGATKSKAKKKQT